MNFERKKKWVGVSRDKWGGIIIIEMVPLSFFFSLFSFTYKKEKKNGYNLPTLFIIFRNSSDRSTILITLYLSV